MTCHVAVLVRVVTFRLDAIEVFVPSIHMKDTSTGTDIPESKKLTTKMKFDLSMLIGVTRDGAPSIISRIATLIHCYWKEANQTFVYYPRIMTMVATT